MAKFMHLYYHHKLPQNFDQYIKSAATHHKYVTRSITNKSFNLQRQNLSYGQCSCNFSGVKIWNKISLVLKMLSYQLFGKKLKKILKVSTRYLRYSMRVVNLIAFYFHLYKKNLLCVSLFGIVNDYNLDINFYYNWAVLT